MKSLIDCVLDPDPRSQDRVWVSECRLLSQYSFQLLSLAVVLQLPALTPQLAPLAPLQLPALALVQLSALVYSFEALALPAALGSLELVVQMPPQEDPSSRQLITC
jgi:hypothetical protein